MNYIKEVKALLVFVGVFLLFWALAYLLSFVENETYILYYSLAAYILICLIALIFQQIFKNKGVSKITSIILFPAGLLLTFGTVFIPFMTIFIHLIFYFLIAFATPLIIIQGLNHFELLSFLKEPTVFFIRITLSVFISVLFNHQIRHLLYLVSPVRIKNSKKLKPFELDKLTDYLISEKNIRFLIYSLYFVSLIAINISELQGFSLTETATFDKAILQSFIAFIAFDRVLSLLKDLEFKPSTFLIRIAQSISNKLKELGNNKDN